MLLGGKRGLISSLTLRLLEFQRQNPRSNPPISLQAGLWGVQIQDARTTFTAIIAAAATTTTTTTTTRIILRRSKILLL